MPSMSASSRDILGAELESISALRRGRKVERFVSREVAKPRSGFVDCYCCGGAGTLLPYLESKVSVIDWAWWA